ncbi:endonuclease V-like [Ruditapes philippinarum]|uniref:endonuclease V-like n=1 Tax=Ruditapes philippinarum TaxID=129788 RepID=UPI00295ADC1F|nr:endonuclease V-like [Ruditapes philippinarum]XP_060591942.1 endonuclease V-like [Ruditapes philippinarum]
MLSALRNCFINYIAKPLGLVEIPTSRAEILLSNEVREKWEREQEELKKRMVLEDSEDLKCMAGSCDPESVKKMYYVAGVDISFVKGDDVNACAAVVVLSFPDLKTVYSDCQMIQLTEPYIPGFLGFREVPFIVDLFEKLRKDQPQYIPHVVMVDGNGILHPKGFGSASHMGVILNLPCIGVAKKLFQVDGLENDSEHKQKIEALTTGGDTFPLIGNSGKTLGMALRSCNNTKNPVYVSPGNLVTMDTAVKLVHKCCKHRVPEPVRLADINSREYLRDNFKPEAAANT